jgi:hypothetical protein
VNERLPKPERPGPAYAGQFRDPAFASAYPNRPPYPPETFSVLISLLAA